MTNNSVVMMQSAGARMLNNGSFTPTSSQSKIEKQAVDVALANWYNNHDKALCVDDFVANINDINELVDTIIADTRLSIAMANAMIDDKTSKMKSKADLTEAQISDILASLDEVKVIMSPSGRVRRLHIRRVRQPEAGCYDLQDSTCSFYLNKLVRILKPGASDEDCVKVRKMLLDKVDIIKETHNTDIVHCKNGTYDLITHRFTPYCNDDGTPNEAWYEAYCDEVFTHPNTVINYNKDAKLVVIHNDDDGTDWDIESCIHDFFEGSDIAEECETLAWQIINHAVRRENGGRVWLLTNQRSGASGGGGKDTYINIVKNLLNPDKILTTPIEDLDGEHALEFLPECYAWISSESNGSTKTIENAINFKLLARQSTVMINPKGQKIYPYQFYGMTIQATNDAVKFSEKSDSIFRNLECLPFERTFVKAGKNPRDYIRDDYMGRAEVLEYVLKKVLKMGAIKGYDEDALKAVQPIKMEARENANDVWRMLSELNDDFTGWMEAEIRDENKPCTTIPLSILYKFYADREGWGAQQGIRFVTTKQNFNRDVSIWVNSHPEWEYVPSDKGCIRWKPNTARGQEWLLGYKIDGLMAHSSTSGELIPYIDKKLTDKKYTGYIKYIGKSKD